MKEETAGPVFDRDHALEITDGDVEFLKELIEIFNSEYPQRLAKISQATENKDFKAINETAHSLKGSSANLGLTRVYELSFEIEKMGKEEKIEGIEEVYNKLEEELERFKEFVSMPGWEDE